MRLQLLPDINYKNHVDDLISICGKNNTNDKKSVNDEFYNLIFLNQIFNSPTITFHSNPKASPHDVLQYLCSIATETVA